MTHETSNWPYINMANVPTDRLGKAQRINKALVILHAVDACLLRESERNGGDSIEHSFGLGFKLYTTEDYFQDNSARQLTIVGRPLRVFPATVELSAGPEAVEWRYIDAAKRAAGYVVFSTPDKMLEHDMPSTFEALPNIVRRHYLDQKVREAVEDTLPLY